MYGAEVFNFINWVNKLRAHIDAALCGNTFIFQINTSKISSEQRFTVLMTAFSSSKRQCQLLLILLIFILKCFSKNFSNTFNACVRSGYMGKYLVFVTCFSIAVLYLLWHCVKNFPFWPFPSVNECNIFNVKLSHKQLISLSQVDMRSLLQFQILIFTSTFAEE